MGVAWVAAAAEPTVQLVGVEREGGDLTVYIRADGQIFLGEVLVDEGALTGGVQEGLASDPSRLVVIAADAGVAYGRIQAVVELVRRARPQKIAFELSNMSPLGEAPTLDFAGSATRLDGVTDDDLKGLRPRQHRFPQDPDANVSSFTANTLEFGEWKVGLTGVWVGVLPYVQVGTSPALDVAQAWNLWTKAELMRTKPIDGALMLQYYRVPPWAFDLAEEATNNVFKGKGGYLGLGAIATLKPANPWSIHLTGYWARPWVKGNVDLNALPPLLFPGLEVPKTDAELEGRVTGDLVVASVATDLRFNRRDSIYVWGRVPLYGSARGQISAADLGAGIDNLDVIVAYGDALSFTSSYSVAFGYMASWRNFEARIGYGVSAVPALWVLQAFDLSYRFGGETRTNQRDIRQGFREQKKDLKDQPPPAPAPVPAPADPTPPPAP